MPTRLSQMLEVGILADSLNVLPSQLDDLLVSDIAIVKLVNQYKRK